MDLPGLVPQFLFRLLRLLAVRSMWVVLDLEVPQSAIESRTTSTFGRVSWHRILHDIFLTCSYVNHQRHRSCKTFPGSHQVGVPAHKVQPTLGGGSALVRPHVTYLKLLTAACLVGLDLRAEEQFIARRPDHSVLLSACCQCLLHSGGVVLALVGKPHFVLRQVRAPHVGIKSFTIGYVTFYFANVYQNHKQTARKATRRFLFLNVAPLLIICSSTFTCYVCIRLSENQDSPPHTKYSPHTMLCWSYICLLGMPSTHAHGACKFNLSYTGGARLG